MKSVWVALAVIMSGCMATTAPESKVKKMDPKCLQKGETGRCRAAIRRYYFDSEKGKCQMFIWGGCGGIVPFETMESCQKTCL